VQADCDRTVRGFVIVWAGGGWGGDRPFRSRSGRFYSRLADASHFATREAARAACDSVFTRIVAYDEARAIEDALHL
jgi:hypothetical protein